VSLALATADAPPAAKTYGRAWYIAPDREQGRPRGLWAIEARPDVVVKLKRIFPRIEQARARTLTIVDTAEFARDLSWVMERYPLDMDPRSRARLDQRTAEHVERELNMARILGGAALGADRIARTPALPPREYQTQAADLCLSSGRLLVADDLGLGKTFTGLLLLRDPDSLPALVVTLTDLTVQWRDEVQKFFPDLRTHIVRTRRAYNPTLHPSSRGKPPHVLIMNYAKLLGWGDYLAGIVKTVIFDEAQELRRDETKAGVQTAKYQAACMVADEASFTMELTATPVYNYGGEMYNVLRVLDADALGSKQEFAREWAEGSGDKMRVREPKAFGSYLRDQGLMIRRTRQDVGVELPELTPVRHTIDTDHDTLDRLTGDALDLAELILSQESSRLDRFQASGDLDWRMRHATGVAKAPYVADFTRMLLESEEKVVLWGWHHDVYDIWRERLEDHFPAMFTGRESTVQKRLAVARFLSKEEPGEVVDLGHISKGRVGPATNLLIMSLRAGAGLHGLQDACKVGVFGELDWSPGIHEQALGRLHRPGQVDPVVGYFLFSNGGTDPLMGEVLDTKRMQSEPMRDPDREIVETRVPEDRVRQLAMLVRQKARRS
jgi:SNF2 family DNA or RNA helicase